MGTEMKKLIWYTTLVVGLIGIPISALAIDAEDIIKTVRNIACSFGGINLEDIGAPDCFVIEEKLKEIFQEEWIENKPLTPRQVASGIGATA